MRTTGLGKSLFWCTFRPIYADKPRFAADKLSDTALGKPAAKNHNRPGVLLNGAFQVTLPHFDAKMTGIGIDRKA